MAYTLTELADDLRDLLIKSEPSDCRAELCATVSRALSDDEFISTHLSDRTEGEKTRQILFEDDGLGFCICAHVNMGEAIGKPHDHGSSWALYGQARGTTEMTDWNIVTPGNGDQPSLVEPGQTYVMNPGDTHFYGIGDVHSPKRLAPTKLLRIEGANLDHVKRSKIAAAP